MLSHLITATDSPSTKLAFHRDLEAKNSGFAYTFAKLIDAFIQHDSDLEFGQVTGAEPAWRLVEKLFSDELQSSHMINPWAHRPVEEFNPQVMIMRDHFKLLILERKGSKPS